MINLIFVSFSVLHIYDLHIFTSKPISVSMFGIKSSGDGGWPKLVVV